MDNPLPFLAVGVVFVVLGVALQTRATWVWYAGWVFFYTVAAYRGSFFFTALFKSRDGSDLGFVFCIFVGTMMFWVPAVVWWSKQRDKFGARTKRVGKARSKAGDAGASTPES